MAQKKETTMTFELALAELEEITASLESGKLTLDQSLDAFERGVVLTRFCKDALSNAEQRISLIMKNGQGTPAETPLNTEDF